MVRRVDINHYFQNQMAGAVGIEPTYHGSEPSVIAVIRNPNESGGTRWLRTTDLSGFNRALLRY